MKFLNKYFNKIIITITEIKFYIIYNLLKILYIIVFIIYVTKINKN